MKSTNYPSSGLMQKFSRMLPESILNGLAASSGFMLRRARKLSPLHFVLSFFLCCSGHGFSLRKWASGLTTLCGATLSKQGLDSRLGDGACRFCKALLGYLIGLQTRVSRQCRTSMAVFERILVQDSTTFALRDGLKEAFKGSVSHGVQKAVLRLKVILDLCSMQVLQLGITSFSHNDQSAASNIHSLLRKGTLVIRDLGYWSVDSLAKISGRGAYFLCRLKYGVSLYDDQARPIQLKSLLKQKIVDRWIRLSRENKLAVRLLIVPLDPPVAEQRIRKARQNRDRRLHHSGAYYNHLRYNIFVTNVGKELCTPFQLEGLYGLRWQIEMLFKGLKSGALHLSEMLSQVQCKAERIHATLTLALCFVLLTLQRVYSCLSQNKSMPNAAQLSLLKTLQWTAANPHLLYCLSEEQLSNIIQYYCCYEKRKRPNLTQKLQLLT